jgi:peptide chain release factor 1
MKNLFQKFELLEKRREDIAHELTRPETAADQEKFRRLSKEYADSEEPVTLFQRYRRRSGELEAAREMAAGAEDAEMKAMAREEEAALAAEVTELEKSLLAALLPRDPSDEKNVILEIRAGTGGEEAALFARELFRMYMRYAELRGWRLSVVDLSETGRGGVKELQAIVEGKGAYSRLKFESGTHRVQRVPETEASGRVHTSAATVAVLPEAEEVDIQISEKDIRVDRFCASGHGGQSVNTTYSAVRVVHVPTGVMVQCQDEKSQQKNLAKAMRVLKARLLAFKREEEEKKRSEMRRSQVGTGDRSEKIRTYNYPQNRVTDHRVNMSLHELERVLDGGLDPFIDALAARAQARALEESGAAK